MKNNSSTPPILQTKNKKTIQLVSIKEIQYSFQYCIKKRGQQSIRWG